MSCIEYWESQQSRKAAHTQQNSLEKFHSRQNIGKESM